MYTLNILLCDELTGALDTKSSKSVLKVIEKVILLLVVVSMQ